MKDCSRSADDCASLHDLADEYRKLAKQSYESDPELQSIMLLTVLDFWKAIDIITCEVHPLMSNFSPELPASFLEPLPVASPNDMQRLLKVERHIRQRHRARWQSSMFGRLDEGSFQVSFSDQSDALQGLLAAIEEEAGILRVERTVEWRNQPERYSKNKSEYDSTKHFPPRDGPKHKPSICKKCTYQKTYRNTSVKAFDEPLPPDETSRKAIVFELREVDCWRSFTWSLGHGFGT